MIGDRIKTLREQMGYGLTEFADMVGVKKQTLYKYEQLQIVEQRRARESR